ncbi:MAG: metal-dependent hydrolase [Saprospiraceae bacterium]|nr:metal-dependent hydrolase [Saprospiraceae bacterium]
MTMASAFTHAFSAFALGSVLQTGKLRKGLILTGMLSAAMPDLDVIAFWLDIPYEHPLGHRGLTHSILFAAIWALGIGYLFWRNVDNRDRIRWRIWFYLFLCTASHGVLDAMTTGGRGVGFFIPLDNDRYFLPWRFIQVSPIRASAFFSEYGLKVLTNEFVTVWLPCMIVMIIVWMFRQWRKA